jgi:hypothetical protein
MGGDDEREPIHAPRRRHRVGLLAIRARVNDDPLLVVGYE